MTYAAIAEHEFPSFRRELPPNFIRPAISCVVALALSAAFVQWMSSVRLPSQAASPPGLEAQWGALKPSVPPSAPVAPIRVAQMAVEPSAPAATAGAGVDRYAALFDPAPAAGRTPGTFAQNAPLASRFTPPAERIARLSAPVTAEVPAASEPKTIVASNEAPRAAAPLVPSVSPVPPVPVVAERVDAVPMPPPRPADLSPPAAGLPRLPSRRRLARQSTSIPRATAMATPDHRNFFERLFGVQQEQPGPAMAYAAPDLGGLGGFGAAPARAASFGRQTAVYEIATHTVYLPDGTRLEAHSGLGANLDDPRGVTQRMRGATPPNVYELTPREQPFHGVRALRLNPVGGTTFGRNGLLAHTYMLGPRGDSNGCVSFRDYNAFLQAYESGSVRRLAVVARLN